MCICPAIPKSLNVQPSGLSLNCGMDKVRGGHLDVGQCIWADKIKHPKPESHMLLVHYLQSFTFSSIFFPAKFQLGTIFLLAKKCSNCQPLRQQNCQLLRMYVILGFSHSMLLCVVHWHFTRRGSILGGSVLPGYISVRSHPEVLTVY